MTEQPPTADSAGCPAMEGGPIADTVGQAVRDAAGKAGATAADTWAHTALYTGTGTGTGTEKVTAARRALLLLLDDGAHPDGVPRRR